jgi:hypothetical protein
VGDAPGSEHARYLKRNGEGVTPDVSAGVGMGWPSSSPPRAGVGMGNEMGIRDRLGIV